MAKLRDRKDYEVTFGLQSKISMQFFSLSTVYPDMTDRQVVNSIRQVLEIISDIAEFRYVYARDMETLQMITFDEFPAGIVKSEQLKEIRNERKRNS